MNSDAGFLRLATKLGIPSFIRTGNSQCGFRAGRIFQVQINALEIPSHFSQGS